MDRWQSCGKEGQLEREKIGEWSDGERILLIVQETGSPLVGKLMEMSELWKKVLAGRKWKKKEWMEWIENNPGWEQEWKAPEDWLPGEKQWFEEEDSWLEKLRRKNVKMREFQNTLGERNKEVWLRAREEEKLKKEVKRVRRLREEQEREEWWKNYHAEQLRKLKEHNREESEKEKESSWKEFCEEQLEEIRRKESRSGSEGHPPYTP
jgi:hypothetical protein